ncbi:hypothetical protein [Spongiimicrobium salis]|uniref:hypothetical protein n=1 Tax=Spongiimicrobium salis TaxID=1667022 RepID=UPI00374D7B70
MKKTLFALGFVAMISTTLVKAQSKLHISEHLFQVDALNEEKYISFTKKQLKGSQFILIGEQHGIKEVGVFTNAMYRLAENYGYKTLCIETDALAAEKIMTLSDGVNTLDKARKLYGDFPFAIPFYGNEDDYELFKKVVQTQGNIWGIDQTFMVQFRMNFDHISKTTKSKKLKKKVLELKLKAERAFEQALATKDFNGNYIFQYDESTHTELLDLAENEQEKEVFRQFWKTKEIYAYNNLSKEYYKNNNVRGQLMKENFMRYYREAEKNTATPKVIFKLGANHAAKGLTRTNIYDIGNLANELAISRGNTSKHYMVVGLSGKATTGNPFTPDPVISFDNSKQLPKELQDMQATFTKKYIVLNVAALRPYAYGKRYSEDLKKLIFGYDVLVLVNNAEAVRSF